MNRITNFFVSCLLIIFNLAAYAQEDQHKTTETVHEGNAHAELQEEHEAHKTNGFSIAGAIGHTHIRTAINTEGDKEWLSLPSFLLNFNYMFNEKWGIGLHNDIIVEEFEVEDPNAEPILTAKSEEEESVATIERGIPVSSAVVLMYQPLEHLVLLAGGGMEFSKNENFAVIRVGVDVPFHLKNNWELFGAAAFDFNIDAYNSYTFGLGIAKLF
ncbi:MAG: hypothetical protein U5K51_13150 [Flavobacteriaceae bacterium]|nr:hypothetical protein [Flavobacteriaceae bacterium]